MQRYQRYLAFSILIACGGGREASAPASESPRQPPARAAAAAAAASVSGDVAVVDRTPCPAAVPLACKRGHRIAWDPVTRKTWDAPVLVTDAGGATSLFWTRTEADILGISVTRACTGGPSGPDVALPGATDATFETAASSGPLTIVAGVLGRGHAEADLALWLDRGTGFAPAAPLSTLVRPHSRARAAVNTAGVIGIAWLDGPDVDGLRFAVLDADGHPRFTKLADLGRYSYHDIALIALPAGGWMLLLSGQSSASELQAFLVNADGTAGARKQILTGELHSFAATWDGDAVAIAIDWGDFARAAGSSGQLGWGAIPDTHEIRFLRIAADATPLGAPIALDRAADVHDPTGLVYQGGSYWLAGGTQGPPVLTRTIIPQLVRFDRTGTISEQLPLGYEVEPGHVHLHAHGGTVRGAVADPMNALRTFTLTCD